jgi:hypothetical protein
MDIATETELGSEEGYLNMMGSVLKAAGDALRLVEALNLSNTHPSDANSVV